MEEYREEAKQIFKVGDKVFDFTYGWGNIVEYSESIGAKYPIKVEFGNETEEYTKEGCLFDCITNSTLSLTEYTLQGFSQERPIELPEVGELCLFSDSGKNWICTEFGSYNPKITHPYTSLRGVSWKHIKRIKILD